MTKPFTLEVTMVFSEDDLQTIIEAYNSLNDEPYGDKPLTLNELKDNPELQEYLKRELAGCSDEIVEGSYDALANDWLDELEEYR